MLTNLKLVNVKLTKENMELRDMLTSQNSHKPEIPSPCSLDMVVSLKKTMYNFYIFINLLFNFNKYLHFTQFFHS